MYTLEHDENTLYIYMGKGEFENVLIKFFFEKGSVKVDSGSIFTLFESMEWEIFIDTYLSDILDRLENGRKAKEYNEIFVGMFGEEV